MIALWIGLGVIVVSLCLAGLTSISFEIPAIFISYYDTLFGYMYQGLGILDFFCPLDYIKPFFTIWLLIHAAYLTYCILTWVYNFIN